jgi:hypothetical protein
LRAKLAALAVRQQNTPGAHLLLDRAGLAPATGQHLKAEALWQHECF